MAEFKEVVRRRNKICEYYRKINRCEECPLNDFSFCFALTSMKENEIRNFEKALFEWEEPIKELTIEEAKKLPQGLEIEVRDDEDDEWHLRDFVTAYKGLFWCECSSDSTALISWRHARLKGE